MAKKYNKLQFVACFRHWQTEVCHTLIQNLLVEGITEENTHEEIDWGKPVGKEIIE